MKRVVAFFPCSETMQFKYSKCASCEGQHNNKFSLLSISKIQFNLNWNLISTVFHVICAYKIYSQCYCVYIGTANNRMQIHTDSVNQPAQRAITSAPECVYLFLFSMHFETRFVFRVSCIFVKLWPVFGRYVQQFHVVVVIKMLLLICGARDLIICTRLSIVASMPEILT